MYLEPKMVAANDGDVIFSRSHGVSAQISRLYYTEDIFRVSHLKVSGARAAQPRARGFAFRLIPHARDSSGAHMNENKRDFA